jgi:peptidoglycan-associated lipoprotein
MRTRALFYVALALCVALTMTTGCKSRKKSKTTQPGMESSAPALGAAGGIESAARPMDGGEWQQGMFAAVYFDYDSATIRASEMSKVEAVATHLRGTSEKLVVEGHADERGTAEYNRALAERRAQAAREELVRLGVGADRISTVSYGEERTADPGHDEMAWSKNRRCEFVVVGQ